MTIIDLAEDAANIWILSRPTTGWEVLSLRIAFMNSLRIVATSRVKATEELLRNQVTGLVDKNRIRQVQCHPYRGARW